VSNHSLKQLFRILRSVHIDKRDHLFLFWSPWDETDLFWQGILKFGEPIPVTSINLFEMPTAMDVFQSSKEEVDLYTTPTLLEYRQGKLTQTYEGVSQVRSRC